MAEKPTDKRWLARLHTFWAITERGWVRALLLLWALVGGWNTFRGELIPPRLAEKLPNTFGIVAVVNQALPIWAWLLGFAAILVIASFEYVHRLKVSLSAPPASLQSDTPPPKKAELPPSLSDLFANDFTAYLQQTQTTTLKSDAGIDYEIGVKLLMDFPSKTEFMAFFIPFKYPPATERLLRFLAVEHRNILAQMQGAGGDIAGGYTGDSTLTPRKNLTFTGRVYIYHEEDMDDVTRGDVAALFRQNGSDVIFRGSTYQSVKLLLERGKTE
jgi:hypothetical protein